ncbi:hypothetical protein FAGAP_12028 [Fusarium agapanthi]|uniref:Heterokaryon incompatibility domain-containing protein n=1 Tax=Fusarium agapanthi TaxID=1803897 RepID=A0A9P5AYT3_9HYPO|nr:hypothetical protein FAGAP_12028 [Fusarium agapanthi]
MLMPSSDIAQEKLLYDNDVVRNLTEEQWKAFGQWVGANDPTPLEAKHWITKENDLDLDLNVFSLQTLALLIKHAKSSYCGQSSKILGQSYTEDDLLVRKPGFGLPLDHMPDKKDRFPTLFPDEIDDGWNAVMNCLIERDGGRSSTITKLQQNGKWKKEALAMDWKSYLKYADFTSAMADACIQELRIKADLYEKTGLIPVHDYSVAVLKSDTIMTAELAKSLQEAIKVLEDIAPEQQDWHPGSDGKVLDIGHPSLWPLTYGPSRILLDRVIGLKNTFTAEGQAVMIRTPTVDGFRGQSFGEFSQRFQWLLCDVILDPVTGTVEIASYINNLHPQEHAHLYPTIESFIKKSLPAWDILYRWQDDFAVQRLQTEEAILDCPAEENVNCGCRPWDRPLGQNETPRHPYEPGGEEYEEDSRWSLSVIDEVSDTFEFCEGSRDKNLSDQDDSDQDDSDPEHGYFEGSQWRKLDEAWFKSTHRVNVSDADPNAADYVKITPGNVKTTGFFKDKKQILVIVKLANIQLTPESASYDDGSWHTEGQLNEHIVSTALYYYDSENITHCTLSFRTNTEDLSDEISYNQYEHGPICQTFAIERDGNRQQDIGSVHTKARRAIFFPNLMQHRVSPFKLVDRTKPGHRKILALFLVDPAIPIIRTSNVPPQQKNWWDQYHLHNGECLPDSFNDKVSVAEWPMGLEEAKVLRLQLMDERTSIQEQEYSGLFQQLDRMSLWGSSATQNKPSIIVEGKRTTVTPNLLQALLDLGENGKSRTVWADAVCINQEDNSEKDSQVLLMTEVYKQASKVLIHLCKENDSFTLLLWYFNRNRESRDQENVYLELRLSV